MEAVNTNTKTTFMMINEMIVTSSMQPNNINNKSNNDRNEYNDHNDENGAAAFLN